jgi:hypothetical protein
MKIKGYMVELNYEGGVLTAHARNKIARMAMASEPELSHPDLPLVESRPVEPLDEDNHLALRFYAGAVAEEHQKERQEELGEQVRLQRWSLKPIHRTLIILAEE